MTMQTPPLDTVPAQEAPDKPSAPPLKPVEFARWMWRQLTSMRTALLLLFGLAVASVPGSILPQRQVNPVAVLEFRRDNPGLGSFYNALGLFDVFGAPWFAAIYLALLVSLIGCIVPRTFQHVRALRARPPAAPRNLDRMPEHRSFTTSSAPTAVLASAKEVLKAGRFRVVDDGSSLAAERGYLREVGNLVFHLAVVVVLLGAAIGTLFGFKGTALVVVGNGFSNTVTQYDGYQGGRLFDEQSLAPFSLKVEKFTVRFETQGEQRGAAREFDAQLAYVPRPGDKPREYHLQLNHPLEIDGSRVHLIGHGYAPRFTIRDGNGDVAYTGPTPFLPQDGNFSSTGVVKAPDARPEQLGLQGIFAPTAMLDPKRGPISAFPDAIAPAVFLTAYHGDLNLDDGIPQSVYRLDLSKLTQYRASNGEPVRYRMVPGQTVTLPSGAGTVTFEGYSRWVNLQISRDPGTPVVLMGAVLALGGLLLSLVVRRRRAWVRVTEVDGRTVVEVAGLDRTEGGELGAEIDKLTATVQARAGSAEEER